MLSDAGRLLEGLPARLHSLETPISELPVTGYAPPSGRWRPRPAAVLIPVLAGSRPEVVLTLRAPDLARHAGQVAFPGGRRDAADASVLETALRETREETGIEPETVRPLGYLGRYDTVTAYRMTAVVGVIESTPEFRPDPREVEAVFKVPLADILDPDRYETRRIEFRGRVYEVLTLTHPHYHIWGATAALLDQFRQRITD